MPNQITLPVAAGNLPNGFCPQSEQARLAGYAAVMSVTLNGLTGIVVSATKPSDTTQTWLQLDSLGRPVRLYQYAAGSWLSLHPQVPGAIMLWDGALPTFSTFDGGDSNAPGPASGPMWEEVAAAAARFPIHPGTLPSTTVVPVAGTGGLENVTLVAAQIPAHAHALTTLGKGNADGNDTLVAESMCSFGVGPAGSITNLTDLNVGGTAHTNMPPFYGVYLLRRTSRLFYSVA